MEQNDTQNTALSEKSTQEHGTKGEISLPSEDLTPLQRSAIPYFVAAKSIEAGARRAKISPYTHRLWLRESEAYRAELDRQREVVIREALGLLKSSIAEAVEVLVQSLRDRKKFTKQRAAERIIEYYFRLAEQKEIEERIEVIEKLVLEKRTVYR